MYPALPQGPLQPQPGYPAQQLVGGYQSQPSQAQSVGGHQSQRPQPQPISGQHIQQISSYKQLLQSTIQEKRLQFFYPSNDPRLDQAATVAALNIDQVCARWRLPPEVGQDLARLALFDIILYIDNSGSMQFDEEGERINDLRQVLNHVVDIVSLFDSDGFSIRFMNAPRGEVGLDYVKNIETVNEFLSRPGLFHGTTPLGTELQYQILNDIVRNAQTLRMPKPVLVITITDGIPVGEPKSILHDAIYHATKAVAGTKCGPGAISFQFAQVGNDKKAHEFLNELDNDPQIGHLIDCTSNHEQESEQMRTANPPVDLTPQLWMLKMLVGAIDSSYDSKDEIGSGPSGQAGGGPPPQYSTHPQHGTQEAYGQQQSLQQPSYQPYNQQTHGQPPPRPYYGQPGYGQPQPTQQGHNTPYCQSFSGQQLTPQQGSQGHPYQSCYQSGYPPQQGSSYDGRPPPKY